MEELLLSLIQLVVAVILSAIAAFLAFYLFQWFTRSLDEWQALRDGNAAVGLVLGALLAAAAIVLRPALSVDQSTWDVGQVAFIQVLLVEAVQVAVGMVLAVVTMAVALLLFTLLTRGLDEVEELRKGNMAVAGLLAGVVIGTGLLVSQAIGEVMRLVAALF